MEPLARGAAIARLKEIAARLGKDTVTREEFARGTGLTRNYVHRRLGRYTDLLRAAGLRVSNGRSRVSDDDLLAALRDALKDREGRLTFTQFKRSGPYSVELYRSRWGGWQKALAALSRWLEAREPDFPYREALRERLQAGRIAGRRPMVRIPRDERDYGRIVNLPVLQHAPTNENAVIYLFGTLASELGFVVETITPGFPDCTAKRRLDTAGERWTRVRIEFEYESRNFVDHGHDPEGCDLIVCWRHNWKDCPVEVMELKAIVAAHSPPSCRT
jgi:hypothetical protein